MSRLDQVLANGRHGRAGYNYAYLDESAKREVRRALVKALCLPGHQIPFASREMPVARGWGSGGLQISLSVVQPGDRLKVIDQGDDDSMNAQALRALIAETAEVDTTTDARDATLIQTRHRIPEDELREEQVVVFQVPIADPLRVVDARPSVTRRMHADGDYAPLWLYLYEDVARLGAPSFTHSHPIEVHGSYIMSPTPIPRHDVPRLNCAPFVSLFGAGREATVYALPPYTKVKALAFDDRPFEIELFDRACASCGSTTTYLTEQVRGDDDVLVCSDTDFCRRTAEQAAR
ncbi:MAG: alpha-D-ribose 1-methylphosphonate 5-phosphate C-P-lyase PhnJ [Chloroflexi bacterium]|nr:alpha-D-ribose 1-methylphosphonate 5-phosphate C-P-lyase PhnJ [Chloroflexota bacterium]